MKKIINLLITVMMLMVLAACGTDSGSTPAPSDTAAPSETATAAPTFPQNLRAVYGPISLLC